MNLRYYFKKLKEERFSSKFILSKIILKMKLNLPIKINLNKSIKGKIYLHSTPISHSFFLSKSRLSPDIMLFREFIKKGDMVLDIGANVGTFSILFSQLCNETGIVFSFEPTKKVFKYLLENINLNNINNIIPINAAISDVNGILSLVENEYSDEQNYLSKNKKNNSSRVLSLRLDFFFSNIKADSLDFLKIDTEGAELLVLKSLGKKIQNVKVIYFEFNSDNYSRFNYTKKDIIKFLKKNNFEIFLPVLISNKLRMNSIEGTYDKIKNTNLLAINKNDDRTNKILEKLLIKKNEKR